MLSVAVLLIGIPTLSLASGLTTAAILARPAARKAALVWHRPICATVATALVVLATSIVKPLLS